MLAAISIARRIGLLCLEDLSRLMRMRARRRLVAGITQIVSGVGLDNWSGLTTLLHPYEL